MEPRRKSRTTAARRSRRALGFSLLEMLFATLLLLVALVGIAQLIPASVLLNQRSRMNSSLLVVAQHELDKMLDQPFAINSFTDSEATYQLGDPLQPGVIVGNNVATFANRPVIDFSSSPVSGYSVTYVDPNDPAGTNYDVRWAVITQVNGSATTSRRFILGVRQLNGSTFIAPVTLDTWVQK